MSQALIVVDMMPYFPASEKALAGVLAEIKSAVKNQYWVFLVELDLKITTNHSKYRTNASLLTPLANYELWRPIKKYKTDGSRQVIQAFSQARITPKVIDVCGVNLDACVEETAIGLATRCFNAQVNILKSASAWSCSVSTDNYQLFCNQENLRVL